MQSTRFDYIVIGGGLTGCIIAHRLREKSHRVLLIEAGSDPSNDENFPTTLGGFAMLGGKFDYNFKSRPEKNTYGRVHDLNAGKALGGGSSINFGGWLRADSNDYDAWANLAQDQRWTYKGLLPWFRKVESFFDPKANSEAHGFDGPVKVTSISASDPGRRYPLREPIKAAWHELGIPFNPDNDDGSITGLAEIHENAEDGKRQASFQTYPLDGVDVLTEAVASHVTFKDGVASGVQLVDGRHFEAKKEVVLCAGAFRTPQILMLSGIGPAATLEKHGVPLIHAAPEVGENLHDHFCIYLAFRLKDPNRNLAIPKLTNPACYKGLPGDWIVNELEQPVKVRQEMEKESQTNAFARSLVTHPRPLVESFMIYVSGGISGVPADGTHISSSTMILTPTSRGAVSIGSSSAIDPPVISPGYVTTGVDCSGMTHATRRLVTAMTATKTMSNYIEAEVPPTGDDPLLKGLKPLTADSSDEEILDRIRRTGKQHHHSGGTAAMGTVVDAEGRVIGVQGLRVADASILPVPLGGHPQATLYAMAEQLAAMILSK